jgi:hypothetical protein
MSLEIFVHRFGEKETIYEEEEAEEGGGYQGLPFSSSPISDI